MQEFKPLNPLDVIDGAAEQDFIRVVVIGVFRNGRIWAASSHSSSQFFEDIDRAKTYVESLAVPLDEAEEDGGTFDALPSGTRSDP